MSPSTATPGRQAIDVDPLDLISPSHYGRRGVPHDAWRRLRAESPVQFFEPAGYEDFWAVTRHADIVDIASRPDVFCNSKGIVLLNDQQLAANASGEPFEPGLHELKTAVKAVTYHGLSIRQENGLWQATVIIDV